MWELTKKYFKDVWAHLWGKTDIDEKAKAIIDEAKERYEETSKEIKFNLSRNRICQTYFLKVINILQRLANKFCLLMTRKVMITKSYLISNTIFCAPETRRFTC